MPHEAGESILHSGSREERVLVALSVPSTDVPVDQVSELLSEHVNWPFVIMGAMQHRTLSMLWETLKTRDFMDSAIRSGLTKNWIFYADTLARASLERNRLWLGLVEDIFAETERAGIPLVAIKGAALIGDIYHAGNRMLGDVDTVTTPAYRGEVVRLLESRGFIQGQVDPVSSTIQPMSREQKRFWNMYAHALPKFTLGTGDDRYPFLRFAVGFDFYDPTDEYSYPAESVVTNRIRKGADSNLWVPDEIDTVICLSSHIYREGVSANFAYAGENWHLWKFCDLRQTMLKPRAPGFRDALRDRVIAAGLEIPYAFALHYTHCVYGDEGLRPWLDLFDLPGDRKFLRELVDGSTRYEDRRPFQQRLFDSRRVDLGKQRPVWADVMANGEWW